MEQAKFDIFISYKRKSLPTANNLYYRLTTRGYSTFFDIEEMRCNNFNAQLLSYIDNAKDVFVILEDGSLDACERGDWERDWFCREISFALEKKKNIIPILIGGYKMPPAEYFPDKLKELSLKNAPDFNFSFFEAYLDRLIKKDYLISKPKLFDKDTPIFKFYSNENCQIFKEGKLVCNLEGMSDTPFYLPVSCKGDYRFKVVNESTGECRIINEVIDAIEEKNVEIIWKRNTKIRNIFHNNRIVYLILAVVSVLAVMLLYIGVCNDSMVPDTLSEYMALADTVCAPVDLGLPSGTEWGDRNVGSKRPSDFGDLFAWGEVTTKDDYSQYMYVDQFKPANKITDARHDAASKSLGDEWSLPTEEQFNELISECEWYWTTNNGHNGYEIVGPNGNKIFLPASGWSHDTTTEYENRYGYYWTSERSANARFARSLQFPKNSKGIVGNGYLYYGRSVRAVYRRCAIAD